MISNARKGEKTVKKSIGGCRKISSQVQAAAMHFCLLIAPYSKGTSINYVDNQEGGVLPNVNETA